MSDHKNLLIPGAILLGFIMLLGGIIWAISYFSFRVGTVDMQKIIKESALGIQINKELQAKGKELSSKLQSAKTEAEKKQISEEFQKFQNDQNEAFFNKVKQITAKIAKEKGIRAVSSPQVFIHSDMDLTDTVIKKLDK